MRPTAFVVMLMCVASGCASISTGGAAAPAPPTSATAGATTIVAVAPPATPHPTLWQFLGSDQIHADMACKGQLFLGIMGRYFPFLNGPPPPPPIDDPANLESPNPAVKAAAEVKAEEDAAPAKAQALEYLASVGCGCYPDVQDALLAGLDDCTEVVRFAAAQALFKAAGHPCQTCKSSACCGPKVRQKLMQIAYDTTDTGCYYEPSARVRRVARLALEACGGYCPCPMPIPEEPEEEPVPSRPPPAPGADMAGGAQASAQSKSLIAELTGSGGDDAGVTRRSMMAASQLRGEPVAGTAAAIAADPLPLESQGRVVAKVDGDPIYESELERAIGRRLEEFPAELSLDEQREIYRDELLWAIDVRLLLREVRQGSPAERLAQTDYTVSDGAGGRIMTVADEKLAREYLETMGRRGVQISPDEILARYRRDIDQYRIPPAMRWEQVDVPFDHRTGRDDADALIRSLRQRWLGGRLPAIDDKSLNKVSVHIVDWTELDAIKPAQLEDTLRRLAVGELSPIFEDDAGFHMVRVLERRPEGTTPLASVSAGIEADLHRDAQHAAEEAYLQSLRSSAEIWTIIAIAELPARQEPERTSSAPPAPVLQTRGIGGRLGAEAHGK